MRQKDRKTEQKEMKSLLKQLQLSKKIVKNRKVEHMEQKKHGTAEHVEQENGRRKKISVNFMKNRMHIAQKHKIKIVKMLKMTKKIWKIR